MGLRLLEFPSKRQNLKWKGPKPQIASAEKDFKRYLKRKLLAAGRQVAMKILVHNENTGVNVREVFDHMVKMGMYVPGSMYDHWVSNLFKQPKVWKRTGKMFHPIVKPHAGSKTEGTWHPVHIWVMREKPWLQLLASLDKP